MQMRVWGSAVRANAFLTHCGLVLVALAVSARAQDLISLEQAASRSSGDLTAIYEGRSVTVRGEVSAAPLWALGTYYLPLRDATDHGLLLGGNREQFAGLEPGDWIETSGTIQSRDALPLLVSNSIRKLSHDRAPEPKDVALSDLAGFRYLGLMVRTSGTVIGLGENLGGASFEIADHGSSIEVFLPRSTEARPAEIRRPRIGDRVRVTALATQYSLDVPHDGGFQLMLASAADVETMPAPASRMLPLLFLGGLGAIGLLALGWWLRERRLGAQRQSMRAFHALSEDIISAGSPTEIAEKLGDVLPSVTHATGVRLYLYHRGAKSLECVPTSAEPDPMAVPIDNPPDGLASGAAACLRNRTLLNVPDVRRSPFVKIETRTNLPRSAIFLPLLSKDEILGVLEVVNARRVGYFTLEEQAAAQHLANQVAASLRLQEQHAIREQLFNSEKLAATGKLISGVASELRAPLESIVRLASSLAEAGSRPVAEGDLRFLAGESQRASEIVSRLVSFAKPDDSAARPADVNALIAGLMQFREPEWKTLGLRVQNRLATVAAMVAGAQGQIEQVFLSLLIHAEQCAAGAPGKTISVESSVMARRVLVEVAFSVKDAITDPLAERTSTENGGLGLGVCKGIVRAHGGEIRFRGQGSMARFEVELPLAGKAAKETPTGSAAAKPRAPLTILLVDPEAGSQRQLVAMLSGRGHRVVPVPLEQAADLAQRLRFDAVFWALRASHGRSGEVQESVRALTGGFVALAEAYDTELARTLQAQGVFMLTLPVEEGELDRVLERIGSKNPAPATVRR